MTETINCNEHGPLVLSVIGPVIQVQIGFDEHFDPSASASLNLPDSTYPALIDTGASECCIDSMLAAALNLPIVDRAVISGVHGRQEVNVHIGQIHVPKLRITMYGRFVGVHLISGGQPYSALMGRSFLALTTMAYDGSSGNVFLSPAPSA